MVVRAYTFRGKILVFLLKWTYAVLFFWKYKQWTLPQKNFEENPRETGWWGAVYLGYKYYYRPHLVGESGIQPYFEEQHLDFSPHPDFIPKQTITISVGGDLMPYELLTPESTEHLWDDLGEWFFGTDLTIANLETPIDVSKPVSLVPEVMLNNMLFNGSESLFQAFYGDRFDALSVANNHSWDMGEAGQTATINFLKTKGIIPIGGRTSEKERLPIIEKNGIKIGLLGWTSNLNQFPHPTDKHWLVDAERLNTEDVSLERLFEQIKQIRADGADIVLLMLHTGNAYQKFPSQHTINIFHRIFDESGVDIILGSHPHHFQPIEKYKFSDPLSGLPRNGFGIYSLGDFVAYDIFVWDRLVPLLKLTVQQGVFQGNKITQLVDFQLKKVFLWANLFQNNYNFKFIDSEENSPSKMRIEDRKELEYLLKVFEN